VLAALAVAVVALSHLIGYVQMDHPAWSPDGTHIAWNQGPSTSSRIWIAKADGSRAHPVTGPIDALFQLGWPRDDQLLYDANVELVKLSLTTGHAVTFGSGENFTTDRSGRIVAWHSVASCNTCNGPILVRPLAGGQLRKIGGQNFNESPTLSPEGSNVAYTRGLVSPSDGRESRSLGIWISRTTGGTPRLLSRTGSCPSWSPDGRRIVYLGRTDQSRIRLIAPSGRSASTIRLGDGILISCVDSRPGAWSPDSRRFAFNSLGRLVLVRIPGGQHRVLSMAGVGDFAWSPDSNSLLVITHGRGCSTLWNVPLAGFRAHRLRGC
jgi:Tol biopolymer transport system component